MPKVLINPQFSFGEMSKTAIDMKEHLDEICKKELSKISKTGLCEAEETGAILDGAQSTGSHLCFSSSQLMRPRSTYFYQEMETNASKVGEMRRLEHLQYTVNLTLVLISSFKS